MGTEIQQFFAGHSLPDKAKLKQNLASLGAAKNSMMGKALLRLTKTGIWVFGQDSEPFDLGVKLIGNPEVCTGYVAWYKGEIEGEKMQPLSAGPVNPDDLGPVNSGTIPPGKNAPSGRGWEEQVSIELVTQQDVPLQMVYKTNSLGGKRALLTLASEIAFGMDENPKRYYPIIELGVDSYEHKIKEYGTIYTPMLNIVSWLDDTGQPVVDRPRLV